MRIAILADVHNLFCSAKQCFQSKIDYAKLKDAVSKDRQIIRAVAYLTSRPDVAQEKFTSALIRTGWEIRAKEPKIFLNRANGEKGVVSHPPTVEITMDAMLFHSKVDCICLITGDGSYAPLATHLKSTGCLVEVFGFDKMTSHELQKASTRFIPIKAEWCFPKKENEISSSEYDPLTNSEETGARVNYDEKQPIVPNQPPATSLSL